MSESSLQRRIWMALSGVGARLFRNQVGVAYQGQATRVTRTMTTTLQPGDVVIRNARAVRVGLCVGSSDLIGWRTFRVTSKHFGTEVAQFVAVEIKTESGRESEDQERFRNAVRRSGGVAIVARSEKQAILELNQGS